MFYLDWFIIISHHCYNFIRVTKYIPKIDDYLKILTDEELKDFVGINFSEYFKYIREEQILEKLLSRLIPF